jgi:Flp pilus assembly pilin Flp
MVQEIKRFIHDDSGPELIEWAVVTIILLLATIVILGAIRGALADIYRNILAYLKSSDLTTEETP